MILPIVVVVALGATLGTANQQLTVGPLVPPSQPTSTLTVTETITIPKRGCARYTTPSDSVTALGVRDEQDSVLAPPQRTVDNADHGLDSDLSNDNIELLVDGKAGVETDTRDKSSLEDLTTATNPSSARTIGLDHTIKQDSDHAANQDSDHGSNRAYYSDWSPSPIFFLALSYWLWSKAYRLGVEAERRKWTEIQEQDLVQNRRAVDSFASRGADGYGAGADMMVARIARSFLALEIGYNLLSRRETSLIDAYWQIFSKIEVVRIIEWDIIFTNGEYDITRGFRKWAFFSGSNLISYLWWNPPSSLDFWLSLIRARGPFDFTDARPAFVHDPSAALRPETLTTISTRINQRFRPHHVNHFDIHFMGVMLDEERYQQLVKEGPVWEETVDVVRTPEGRVMPIEGDDAHLNNCRSCQVLNQVRALNLLGWEHEVK
ncbi:Uu.00g003880.m01.CDS01 [Anthostomella pinea]|uniref:Uu.00g003880.m01.CDS01 n=1 Tax=Anthostomella pinea TaxID=933095 RepID=A0AAI8YIW2_9PEZI|nr:Uu.00g003880.m01.CDS01 [Anthostomella pinea]